MKPMQRLVAWATVLGAVDEDAVPYLVDDESWRRVLASALSSGALVDHGGGLLLPAGRKVQQVNNVGRRKQVWSRLLYAAEKLPDLVADGPRALTQVAVDLGLRSDQARALALSLARHPDVVVVARQTGRVVVSRAQWEAFRADALAILAIDLDPDTAQNRLGRRRGKAA